MDADHQLVVALIAFYELQGTRLVGLTAIERVAQKEQNRFATSKLRSLEDSMTKTAFLALIDIMQAFANVQDMVLVLLGLLIQLTQVFLAQLVFKEFRILQAFLLRAQHQADFLDTTLHQLFEQDKNDRAYHAIRTGNGEEILLQGTCSRIQTGAKACHRDDSLTNGMYRIQGQRISLHTLSVQIVNQLLLVFRTTCQELYRAVTMRTNTLATPYPWLDIGILQHLMQLGCPQGWRHRRNILVEHCLGTGHKLA